ncbi:ubiquinol oxidase subunit II [Mesorhizobium sp. BAC0120]|uniref:ubiquinol oxidase subunit II n=1 Tax=Mesorhizobium sp. BAC0120 TaxID=3090670 RepID=UPI00298C4CEC|nr:ubiquinol oxidase subunit II [Mesorhizobium sp. BAC0120]MDW6022627.1 ubiquinol oxidase subunit II [Mesorhizobium sp. BAC0120]
MGSLQMSKGVPALACRSSILGLLCLGLASCSGGVLDPLGPVGEGNATILINATAIMLAIVIPTILLAFWMAWHYRASNRRAEYLPYWSYSGRIEAVVWSIPTLTIMFIGGLIWIGSYQLDPFRPLPSRNQPLEVQVVSLDWKWLFIYPQQGIATINQLVMPVGTPVHFSITSASVFNAFFVPRLGSMIYAMPGMVSQLHLQADRPYELWGISAQFSGDGFSDMQFQVKSLPAAEFGTWAAGVRGTGPMLDQAAYAGLMQQAQRVPPSTFGAIDPQLFHAVATQKIPPGPGPQPESPEHAGREISSGGKD